MSPPEQPPMAACQADFVGIDVSKAHLDIAVRPSGAAWQCPNDEPGIAAVVDRLQALQPAPQRVVLEATGGLERAVTAALADVVPVRWLFRGVGDRGSASVWHGVTIPLLGGGCPGPNIRWCRTPTGLKCAPSQRTRGRSC